MKVEQFSIPLFCSFSSHSICLVLELDSFPVFPSPSFSFFFFFFFFCTSMSPLFTWTVETWKCRRRRRNVRLWLLEEEEKTRAGSSIARLWLLCCNTVCKKSSSKLLLLPLHCKRSKQCGPCKVNPVFFFTKQLKYAVYSKRYRNSVNKRYLRPHFLKFSMLQSL